MTNWKDIIENHSNPKLAKHYRSLMRKYSSESSNDKKEDMKQIIDLIKAEWAKRNDQDVDAISSAAPSQGMMSTMDYRVGDTQGVKKEYRRQIIKEILSSSLPFVESPAYMSEWGDPCSEERYNKIKNFLFGQINNPLQRKNYRAISEWKEDLDWLLKEKDSLLSECNKEKK